ncbi:MAG TPA: hypothetical protein VIM67_07085, partial [Terriglobus sp.]
MVQICKKASTHTLIALLIAPLVGCGSSGSTIASNSSAGPSGKSIQGPISGATIWGDSLSSGTRFSIDSAEQGTQTTTSSGGSYTLKTTPSYKYVIVSQGGTDTLTGKPAATMIAPGGAKAVSPLTTLVMLDSTGKLATTLSSLLPSGASFDSDFTAISGLSPSALMFITSVTSAITTLNLAVADATKPGTQLSALQLNAINMTVYSQLAATLSTLSPTDLSNTATLSKSLTTGLSNAITSVVSTNPNLTIPTSIAATIANSSVASAANVVGNATNNAALKAITASNVSTGAGVTVPTTGTVTESDVVTGANLTLVVNAIVNTANTTSANITVTSTPTGYTPPPITIANNPTVTAYNLIITGNGSAYSVKTFTIAFSDDMVATQSGGTNYAHSVLNPSNYTFSQSGCSPTSYASNTVTFTCSDLKPGTFTVTISKGTTTGGVWASSTSLGLLVDNTKT